MKRWKRWLAAAAAACCLTAAGGEIPCKADGLSAKSAVLYEPESGRILVEKDAHTPRPMASTTKIMTALLALELCDPATEITVPQQAVLVEGSSLGLRGGDRITMLDLVTGLMLQSGNDAANTIAMVTAGSLPAFAEKMNAKAAELGMKDSHFVTPSGLDQEGHASSAYDMALLAAAALRNPLLAEICAKKSAVIAFGNPKRKVTVTNHNKLLSFYPDAVGMKTGFTKKSGRCLVSAARKDGVTLIAVTLNSPDDWNDHIRLYEQGFPQLESFQPSLPELPDVKVAGGLTDTVQLTGQLPSALILSSGDGERLAVKTELPRFVLAPISAGETLGRVRYYLDGREVTSVPLTAAYGVDARPTAGAFGRWLRALRELTEAFFRL